MPGFRRFRSRRMYRGRRFRRGRRRGHANAARATNRLTLVPRHQYLKLKFQWQGSYTGTAAAGDFKMALQNPQCPVPDAGLVSYMRKSAYLHSRGWDEYGALFQRYCVHGVKLSLSSCAQSWLPNVGSTASGFGFMHSCYSTPADYTTGFSDAGSLPLGHASVVQSGGTFRFKKYINMNSLMGEIVKKHDRYVQNWTAADTVPAGNTRIGGFVYNCATQSGGTTNWSGQVNLIATFYISALSVNANLTAPAAEMLKLATDPVSESTMLGDYSDPTAADHQAQLTTGVAVMKGNIKRPLAVVDEND